MANDGNLWVVRARKVDKNAKRLFNEYLAGSLAEEFGLFRPNVQLIDLNVIYGSDFGTDLFDKSCIIGVATQFIKNLTVLRGPPDVDLTSSLFPEKNQKYLIDCLQNVECIKEFYAHRVFSEWVFLEDDWKYEHLHIDAENNPIILDLDMSLNGGIWELPSNYNWSYMFSGYAPYYEGILKREEQFEHWFEKVSLLERGQFDEIISSLPNDEWDIPNYYVNSLFDLLFNNIEHFIEEFKYAHQINYFNSN